MLSTNQAWPVMRGHVLSCGSQLVGGFAIPARACPPISNQYAPRLRSAHQHPPALVINLSITVPGWLASCFMASACNQHVWPLLSILLHPLPTPTAHPHTSTPSLFHNLTRPSLAPPPSSAALRSEAAEPFLSELRLMSFVFPPKGWALCNGQFLPINQNQALFSLLGTTYGGGESTWPPYPAPASNPCTR